MDESIIIEVQDRIDPSIAIKLAKIEALSIKGAIAVEKLFQAEARSTIELERLRTASVNLQISQERLNAAKTQGAIASEKLFQTEGKSTIVLENLRTASTNLETSQQKLSNAKIAGASASEKLFQAEARSTIELEKLRAASNGVLSSEERLKQEQTKTKISTESLTIAQTKLTTEQKKTSIATEKLSTQEQKTAKESKNLEKATDQAALAHLRLETAQKRALSSNNKTEQSHKSVGNSFASMARSLAAYAAAYVGIKEIFSLGNAYVDLENKLRVVTTSQEQLAQVSAQVFDIANRTRTPVEETAKAFSRFDLALIQLGASQRETLNLTETVNKALIVSGANTGEQAAALLQLSQAFNKGKLDGDEFRSVMELMPPVADAIAKKMGVTRGELLKLAPEGKITAKIMKEAFTDAAISIDASFAKTVPTLNQSLVVLKNEATSFFGEIEKGTGSLSYMASLVNDIAKSLPYFAGNVSALTSAFGELSSEVLSLGPSGQTSMNMIQYGIVSASYAMAGLTDLVKAAKLTFYDLFEYANKNQIALMKMKLFVVENSVGKVAPGYVNSLKEQITYFESLSVKAKNASGALLDTGIATEKLEARLKAAGIESDKLRKQQEALTPLNSKISELATKYTALESSISEAEKAGKAFSKPELKLKIAELQTIGKEYEETKKKRDALMGTSYLRGSSKITNKPTEESEKSRKSRLDFEAGVKIKHPEQYKYTSDIGLAENARSVALGKVNDELDQEWSNLQRVGSEQESYNRLQQIMNDLTKAHVFLSDEEVAAYKAKTDALVFENMLNQERNKLYNENKGQIETLRVSKAALNQEFVKGSINAESYNLKLVQLGVKLAELKIKMNDATGSDIAIASFGRVISQYEGLAAGLTSTFADFFTSFQDGFADSIGKAIVEGESLNDTLHNVAKGGLSSLISGLVKLGMQWVINTALGETLAATAMSSQTALSVAAAATTATAWAPAATMTSLASFGANSAPAMIGISSTAGLAEMLSLAAFAKGGEISGGQQLIRVNERGTETVMNAGATARNRPILAAMNAGATVGTGTSVSVKIENYGTSKQFEVQKDNENNIRIIARDEAKAAIRSEVPKLVSSEIANPNSSTSKSLAQNTTTSRRR